ncbi:shikimate kinase AroK [Candidatus Berkiella cookevillensis]|uniref:Shikimate kinase n=1 Tax=Candidatus Berkiella cookevillensis TaxID=437022 RepID=A0A0Q9YMC1_9GAMM|nr:shikimate kinase AroK [Candidatus Berkiella cookevillensis]MCS5709583.1 shikimate kinase AroK [Candidatus Berkiella cookevillensis]
MKRSINLFLVGPMGAGKSTIGKQLAKELKLEFCDVDQEIEDRAGADIGWIFDVEGEEGFRKREEIVIDELSQRQGLVLATGGGAILSAENRNKLAARGTVVYLFTTVEQQLKRTAKDKRRPLLQQKDMPREEKLDGLMESRDPLYREIADVIIDTDGRTVRSVALEVIRVLEKEHLLT